MLKNKYILVVKRKEDEAFIYMNEYGYLSVTNDFKKARRVGTYSEALELYEAIRGESALYANLRSNWDSIYIGAIEIELGEKPLRDLKLERETDAQIRESALSKLTEDEIRVLLGV